MRRAVIAAVVAVGASSTAALADAKSEAEALFRAGEQAFASSRYGDAAQAFEQAYAKLPLPAIAFSTAQAHRLQYFIDRDPMHLQRAVDLYQVYIKAQGSGGRVADATANLAEIEPLYMQLRASGATQNGAPVFKRTTAIMVIADIADARATIDGNAGATPLSRDVELGDHAITVDADGYDPVTRTVTAVPNEMLPVEVHMVARPARLTLHAPGGAHLSIDGRPAGDAPLPVLDVPAGTHLLAVTERGRVPFTRELAFDRGQAVSVDAALTTTRQRVASRWVLIGSAGVAGGAAITRHRGAVGRPRRVGAAAEAAHRQ